MNNIIFHLSTCSTCQRILNELNSSKLMQRCIRSEPLLKTELSELAGLAGGYEPLFSRRAMLYRQMNLGEKLLTEAGYEQLILEHDTFLKRPVAVVDGEIFIGSTKKVIERLKNKLGLSV